MTVTAMPGSRRLVEVGEAAVAAGRTYGRAVKRRIWWLWVAIVAAVMVAAVGGASVAPIDPAAQSPRDRLAPPLSTTATGFHFMGTDALGRDLFSQIVVGARLTLFIGLTTTLIALAVGTVIGLFAGFYGGWIDRVAMRLADAQTALPMFLLALLLVAATGPSVVNLIILLPALGWPTVARVVRAETVRLERAHFVQGVQALGASRRYVLLVHILRNLMPKVGVLFVLELGQMVLAEAGLSFLGAGVQEPDITWGLLIASGREYLAVAWWLTIFPGLVLTALVLSTNLILNHIERRSLS